jgi:hypothetical protein
LYVKAKPRRRIDRTDRPFQNCAAVVTRIRNLFLQDYQKADAQIAKQLLERVETALANARWLAGREEIVGGNPGTSVGTLVQHLKDVAGRPVQP